MMQQEQTITEVEEVDAESIYDELLKIRVFSQMTREHVSCLGRVKVMRAPAGTVLAYEGEAVAGLWCIVEGEIAGHKVEEDGSQISLFRFSAGDSFGEVPLLAGMRGARAIVSIMADAKLLEFGEEGFWRVMSSCPPTRRAILANMEQRLQSYQAFTVHREKLISLGTLAAGLMHELNNPGTAARRAAAQLRENMVRLQQISLRLCEVRWSDEQMECMRALQMRALSGDKPKPMNSIDQSDAEESLAEWLDEAGVANSWQMAPILTAIGLDERELACTRAAFADLYFSDTLNWLTSVISNIQLVGTIEESITRISELVTAVKKYSYNESGAKVHEVDIHDGLRSTVTILAHKLRPKDLKVDKKFADSLPTVYSRGAGLTQVWTNLIDNAVDASPAQGTIHIRTWVEDGNVCVGIADEGGGIAEEHQKHIFDPFFTTKPVGVGTGLGLDIAYRIVAGSYGGVIGFTTKPGWTEFIVRLPIGK
jgi:signal transduction histidine kinase